MENEKQEIIDQEIEESLDSSKNKKKKKRKLIYYSIFGVLATLIGVIGIAAIYHNTQFLSVFISDNYMYPAINSVVKNADGAKLSELEILGSGNSSIERYGYEISFGTLDNKINTKDLKRFDIVCATKFPDSYSSKLYSYPTYRVIGLPGDHIQIDANGDLFVNSKPTTQPLEERFKTLIWEGVEESKRSIDIELSNEEFYLLKDYRKGNASTDSRGQGAFTEEDIIGKLKSIDGVCTYKGNTCVNRKFGFPQFF